MTTKQASTREERRLRKALRAILAALGRERQGDHERAWIDAASKAMDIAEGALGPQEPVSPPLTIEFALPDRRICGNGGAHGVRRQIIVTETRQDAAKIATQAHRDARSRLGEEADDLPVWFDGPGRVAIAVHVKRTPEWSTRKLDDDNMQRGCKPLQDSLQDARIVGNDSRCYYDGPVTWETASYGQGRVIFTLTQEED